MLGTVGNSFENVLIRPAFLAQLVNLSIFDSMRISHRTDHIIQQQIFALGQGTITEIFEGFLDSVRLRANC